MVIQIPWLARLLRCSTAVSVGVNDKAIVIDGSGGLTEIPVASVTGITAQPGLFWSSLTLCTASSETIRIGGIRHKAARVFGAVAVVHKSAPAITKAIETFKTLCDRETYLNYRSYREWRKQYEACADEITFSLDGLPLPSDLKDEVARFLALVREGPKVFAKRNDLYTERLLTKHRKWFDTLERFPLTARQCEAIVHDEDNCLVVAGAGTGKTSTVMGKVGFVLRMGHAKPDEILLLAFTQKAKAEMEERIKEKFATDVDARTFHSLGLEIVAKVEGRKPSLATWATEATKLDELLQRYIGELLSSPQYGPVLVHYLAHYLAAYKPPEQFKSLHEYAQYVKSQDLRTLKNERVNSYEEVMIANWLFLNGIRYEYEAKYPHDTATVQHRQYEPDFYLPDHDLYIEHFGVDRNGRTAPWVNQAEYTRTMAWKRQLHQQHKTTLVETFSFEKWEGMLLSGLETKLRKHGVTPKPLSPEEVRACLNQGGYVSRLSKLTGVFLGHFKSNQHRFEDLRAKAKASVNSQRALAFLQVFEAIYSRYESDLHKAGDIDFHDMIARATTYVEAGRYVSRFKYVVVDEFQDISVGRYRLLKALLDQVPHRRLFCVGDDWQAIYRFAGSDISIMTSFQDRFGYTRTTTLDETFRFNNRLCEFSSKFILKNKHQIRKDLDTREHVKEPAVRVVTASGNEPDEAVLDALADIRRRCDGKPANVLLLGRFNHDRPVGFFGLRKKYPELDIGFMTVHASKGLEADYAVVLNLTAGKHGFPCEMEDDPLLDLVLAGESGFPNAEERRLFYVAVTRARKGAYLVTDATRRSSFIDEVAQSDFRGLVVFDQRSSSPVCCPQCQGGILIRRDVDFKTFWGCSNYPLCEATFEICSECREGALIRTGHEFRCSNVTCSARAEVCPRCGLGMLVMRSGPWGYLWGCTKYRKEGPSCGYTRKAVKR